MAEEKCKNFNHSFPTERTSQNVNEEMCLTINLKQILEKDYITSFMTGLRNQVCCGKANISYLVIKSSDTYRFKITNGYSGSYSLSEVEDELEKYKTSEEYKVPGASIPQKTPLTQPGEELAQGYSLEKNREKKNKGGMIRHKTPGRKKCLLAN